VLVATWKRQPDGTYRMISREVARRDAGAIEVASLDRTNVRAAEQAGPEHVRLIADVFGDAPHFHQPKPYGLVHPDFRPVASDSIKTCRYDFLRFLKLSL
jgi:hypothetical protein